MVTPDFKRPTIRSVFPCGFAGSSKGQGTKMSICVPGVQMLPKSNDFGNTPTTMTGWLSNVSFRPTMPGSEANRRCQNL